jgi:hypothetical protein
LDKKESRIGGAGNVALNLMHLGAKPNVVSVIGTDSEGNDLIDLFHKRGIPVNGIIKSKHRKTTVKTRVISSKQQILRIDSEDTHPVSTEIENSLHNKLSDLIQDNFDAVIECWGGNIIMDDNSLSEKQPISPITLTSSLSAPLLGIFGNDDVSPPPEQVNKHEALLKENKKDYTFHRYDGAGHGFIYYDRPIYRQQQSVDAWDKIFKFSEEKLRS